LKRAILLSTSSILAAIAALAAIAIVVVASSNSAVAVTSLVNGSFETGDLSDWTVDTTASGGTASAVTSYYDCPSECWAANSWGPQDGSYFAQLTPGKTSVDTKTSQPLTASAGDRVSGWAFLEAKDWGYSTYDPAVGQVVVTSDSGTTVATPYQKSNGHCDIWAPCAGQWTYWEYTFPAGTATGKFQIEARIHNTGSNTVPTVMGLDNVKTATLAPDTTKPSTSATRSVEPNAKGWNKGNLTVTLNATDNSGGWGVKKITYSASGAQTIAQTDASGDSVNVTLDKEGTTTLTYYATDNAGNVEDKKTLTVKIDKTAPAVKLPTSPADKSTNVSTSSPNISATLVDSGSGIDPTTITNDTLQVSQWSRQGNKGSVAVSISGWVSYDENSKTVTFHPNSTLASGTYQATVYGYGVWNNNSGVKDNADNRLYPSSYSWSFSTSGKLCCGF
jgi:hypothetical protein